MLYRAPQQVADHQVAAGRCKVGVLPPDVIRGPAQRVADQQLAAAADAQGVGSHAVATAQHVASTQLQAGTEMPGACLPGLSRTQVRSRPAGQLNKQAANSLIVI